MDPQTRVRRASRTQNGTRGALVLAASTLDGLVRLASWAGGKGRTVAVPAEAEDDLALANGRPLPSEPREATPAPAAAGERPAEAPRRRRGIFSSRRRLGSALVFATLFFAGASLSAVAGDWATRDGSPASCDEREAVADDTEPAAGDPAEACETGETETDETIADGQADTGESAAEEGAPAGTAPEADSAGAPPTNEGADPTEDSGAPAAPADAAPSPPEAAPGTNAPASGSGNGKNPGDGPPLVDVRRPPAPTALDPEAEAEAATVWLHRVLPDPTPPARRLAPAFARQLRETAARHNLRWSLLLGIIRAHGNTGRVPVGPGTLARIAGELARHRDALGAPSPWHVALRYAGRTAFADRTLALVRYNRAVGLRALVTGLAAAKPRLAARVLVDPAIGIYAGGRADIAAGRTDVRVLVLLRYLRIAHGSVTVSSLTSGHRVYSRPGVVSAHTYGLAVDIAALGGRPIEGNQEPEGLTERAVRNILLLPAELAPQQVISLLGLGGASFPLADHGDHIHVGY